MTRKQRVALLITVVWIAMTALVAYGTHSLAFVGGMLGLLFWVLQPLGKNASVLRGWHNLWIIATAALLTSILSFIVAVIVGVDPPFAVAISGGLGVFVGFLVKHHYNP